MCLGYIIHQYFLTYGSQSKFGSWFVLLVFRNKFINLLITHYTFITSVFKAQFFECNHMLRLISACTACYKLWHRTFNKWVSSISMTHYLICWIIIVFSSTSVRGWKKFEFEEWKEKRKNSIRSIKIMKTNIRQRALKSKTRRSL